MGRDRAEREALQAADEKAALAEVNDLAAAVALLRKWGLVVEDVQPVAPGASHGDIPVRVDRDGKTRIAMIRVHLRRREQLSPDLPGPSTGHPSSHSDAGGTDREAFRSVGSSLSPPDRSQTSPAPRCRRGSWLPCLG